MTTSRQKGVVKQLSDLSLDEISLVDRGANQHATIAFAKRDTADSFYEEIGKAKGGGGSNGAAPTVETASGDDPAGVTDGDEDDRPIGPSHNGKGGKNYGKGKKGKDTPPDNGSTSGPSSDINPSKLSGLGKSASYWEEAISKALEELDDEFLLDEEDVEKAFPGMPGGQQQGFNPLQPQQSPFPGAAGPAQQPMMQTPGVQPMGMGQPQAPGMAPQQGGMPQQIPPDVVQYIQQLEAALDQALGNDSGSSDDSSGDNDSSGNSGNSDNSNSSSSNKNPFGKSGDFDMTDRSFLTELAKSLDDEDQREAITKAMDAVSKAEERANEAEQIAKAERDLRLEREFVAKAEQYDVPVAARELGPVLKRLAETISQEDFAVIHKCLAAKSAERDIFAEIGKRGGGDNTDILGEVNARAFEMVGKSEGLTPEMAFGHALEANPTAYDEYLRNRPTSLR